MEVPVADVRVLLKRTVQLNVLAYSIIVALVIVVGLLAMMLLADVRATDLWVLRNDFAQVLIVGLLLAVILYMADTHRKLRADLTCVHDELVEARDDLSLSRNRIAFAHQIATTVVSLSEHDAIRHALKESASRFRAEAVAVVAGDEVEVFAEDAANFSSAYSAAMNAALSIVQSGQSKIFTLAQDDNQVLAAPLRIGGHLHAVACLMRRDVPFTDEDEKGLELVARVLELGVQNRSLLKDMRSQLQGMLSMLSTLIEDRQSHYTAHSMEVANLSVAVGVGLHMTETQLEDLKLAALLHDVGMLFVPRELTDAPRELTPDEIKIVQHHPTKGAELARQANFSGPVQQMILSHHERLDGSGYPLGISGREIPLGARIISACDVYDAMIHNRPYRQPLSHSEAMAEIRTAAGVTFDPKVVRALIDVAEMQSDLERLMGPAA